MPWFSFDDAYITLASAQAIWSGTIPAFPDTPALVGVTSPVHVLLVALLLRLLPPEPALFTSNLIGTGLYIWGLIRLARPLCTPAQTALVVLAGLSGGWTVLQLTNGLETSLALAGVTWALVGLETRAKWAPYLLAVLPGIRPELAILSGCGALWLAWESRRIAPLVLLASGLLVLAGGLWWTTGAPVPSSLLVKRHMATGAPWDERIATALVGGGWWLWNLGPLALGILGLAKRRWVLAVTALVVVSTAATFPIVAWAYQFQRYLTSWVPLLVFGGLLVLPVRARTAVLVAAVGLMAVRLPARVQEARSLLDPLRQELAATADWTDRALPGAPLLVGDVGYLGYHRATPIVDLVGLKTAHTARVAPRGAIPMVDETIYYATTRHIRTLVVLEHANQFGGVVPGLTARGWTATPLRPKPAHAHGDWWYGVYRLTPPSNLVARHEIPRTDPIGPQDDPRIVR